MPPAVPMYGHVDPNACLPRRAQMVAKRGASCGMVVMHSRASPVVVSKACYISESRASPVVISARCSKHDGSGIFVIAIVCSERQRTDSDCYVEPSQRTYESS